MMAVLILCFARVDTLKQTIASILAQPHGPIYISCDGPTDNYKNRCAEVEEYVRELLKLGVIQNLRISELNEGTLKGVSKGIDWFFERETTGIIIEDDLVLEPKLLEAVENASCFLSDQTIVSIGLHNRTPSVHISDNTKIARRSRFVISWGWVTTRKEWRDRVTSFREVDLINLFSIMVKEIGLSSAAYHFWFYLKQRKLEKNDVSKCNWDDLWQINCFLKNKSVAVFNRNLITNIGNGEGSMHTFGKPLFAEITPISDLEFKSSDFWKLPRDIDTLSDAFFTRKRKMSTIFKEKLRIRTRLNLK
jgi:hypothetical protein